MAIDIPSMKTMRLQKDPVVRLISTSVLRAMGIRYVRGLTMRRLFAYEIRFQTRSVFAPKNEIRFRTRKNLFLNVFEFQV
jgi:hypothetical protein